MPIDLTYPNIQELIRQQSQRHTTESRAFLSWALEHIYRLEESEADDCICDGPDDKGIDGIYVDDNSQYIDVFQSKLFQNQNRTVGNRSLQTFAGVLNQLANANSIAQMKNTTGNIELKGRLTELEIDKKLVEGYVIRGIFVTNAVVDSNAQTYLGVNPHIVVYGNDEINKIYIDLNKHAVVSTEFTFDTSRFGFLDFRTAKEVTVALAPLPATQLIHLPGIENMSLFQPNIRQSLGRTKVNKEITESIRDSNEHGQFALYHNGITMVAEHLALDRENNEIKIANFFVVNGCQSLSNLFSARRSVTNDIVILE